MLIQLKGCYTILGTIHSNPDDDRIAFTVACDDKQAVAVEVIPADSSVEAFRECEVSENMWAFLQKYEPSVGDKVPPALTDELLAMDSPLSAASRKVLNLIKYDMCQVGLDEQLLSVKGTYWSLDKVDWKRLPMMGYVTGHGYFRIRLSKDSAKLIQQHLESEQEPLLALRHLHRAMRENNARYKWIDASTAAELAVKEVLIDLKPELETLLLELPSPPLHKLYGSVLKYYTGESSPKLSKLQKGEETRNRLIHRPQDMHIPEHKAHEYVDDVRKAIYHLLALLYPEDPAIEAMKDSKSILIMPLEK
jgi:hypothetical protein